MNLTNLTNLKYLALIFIFISSCGNTTTKKSDKEVSGKVVSKDTCDNPDADINCSFLDMPGKLSNIMSISGADEPGEKIIISGKVLHSDSITPYSDLIIYCYHTDSAGYYSKKGNETGVRRWQGHLYGWCKTDSNGYYEIHTIRPGRYPSNEYPAHIHPVLNIGDGSQPFYINDFVFSDDSLVNEKYLASLNVEGGTGVVDLKKSANGILTGERNIILSK